MTRFVIARRRASRLSGNVGKGDVFEQALQRLGRHATLLACDYEPVDVESSVRNVEGERDDILACLGDLAQDLWIEREVYLPLQPTISVEVRSGPYSVSRAELTAYFEHRGARETRRAIANDEGDATLHDLPTDAQLTKLVVQPINGFWSVVVRRVNPRTEIECERLPAPADGLGWWHRAVNIHKPDPSLGDGISIGVIDGRLGRHPALEHVVDAGGLNVGVRVPSRTEDPYDPHATHVCGIIGARPTSIGHGEFFGTAPGATVVHLAAAHGPEGVQQADLRAGIDTLVNKHRVHLINLSLGGRVRSPVVMDMIAEVFEEHGVVCVCAAGNYGPPVVFPANGDYCVAVSAIGSLSAGYPRGSVAESDCGTDPHHQAGAGICMFRGSAFGDGLDCCAPGVGIVSCVPKVPGLGGRPWGVLSGTSMAAPVVTGVLAANLARSRAFLEMEPGKARAELIRSTLEACCMPVGLHRDFQGFGLPQVVYL